MPIDRVEKRALSHPQMPFFTERDGKTISERSAVSGSADAYGSQHVILADSDGNVIDSIATNTPAMDGQSVDGINVTNANTEVLAANPNRAAAIIVNDSDTVIYVAIGENAGVNKGTRLNPAGGTLVISKYGSIFSTEAINAIHGGAGNKVLSVQEFI